MLRYLYGLFLLIFIDKYLVFFFFNKNDVFDFFGVNK